MKYSLTLSLSPSFFIVFSLFCCYSLPFPPLGEKLTRARICLPSLSSAPSRKNGSIAYTLARKRASPPTHDVPALLSSLPRLSPPPSTKWVVVRRTTTYEYHPPSLPSFLCHSKNSPLLLVFYYLQIPGICICSHAVCVPPPAYRKNTTEFLRGDDIRKKTHNSQLALFFSQILDTLLLFFFIESSTSSKRMEYVYIFKGNTLWVLRGWTPSSGSTTSNVLAYG